jgi:hypothetical protein
MQRFSVSVLVLAVGVLMVTPALAGARAPGRSFEKTYPKASALCAKADAGTLKGALAASTADVVAACTTLKASFAAAGSTYKTTTDPLATRAEAAVSAARAACATAETSDMKRRKTAACKEARRAARAALRVIRTEARAAAKTYVSSVRASRSTFWTSIHALRGAGHVPADGTTTAPPAAPTVPADTTL